MKKFNNIRHFREFKGYSQKYVAVKLGKSQAALSKIENGSIYVSDDIIEQLSEILEAAKEKLYSNEQLILDCNNGTSYGGSFNGEFFLKTEKELLPSLNSMTTILINQLSQNEKLLHEVESNQKQIKQQLNVLLKVMSDKITYLCIFFADLFNLYCLN